MTSFRHHRRHALPYSSRAVLHTCHERRSFEAERSLRGGEVKNVPGFVSYLEDSETDTDRNSEDEERCPGWVYGFEAATSVVFMVFWTEQLGLCGGFVCYKNHYNIKSTIWKMVLDFYRVHGPMGSISDVSSQPSGSWGGPKFPPCEDIFNSGQFFV